MWKAYWWSSDTTHASSVTDAWQRELSAAYRSWAVPGRLGRDFSAQLRRFDLSGVSLVECICSPCAGRRLPLHIRQDDEPHVGIQIVLAGRERFRSGEDTIEVAAGDTLAWASDRVMEFEVTEKLHKVTLMVPLALLKEELPRGTGLRIGRLDGTRGLGAMLFSQLNTLRTELKNLAPAEMLAARRSTLELTTVLIADHGERPPHRLAQQYLRNVQAYLLDHLHHDLNPTSIANANRISVRYLHMLFAETGATVSSWIQEQRLKRCRAALEDPTFDRCTLAEIGWRWGFKDPSHFSRVFKAQFGLSPRDCRARRAAERDLPACSILSSL